MFLLRDHRSMLGGWRKSLLYSRIYIIFLIHYVPIRPEQRLYTSWNSRYNGVNRQWKTLRGGERRYRYSSKNPWEPWMATSRRQCKQTELHLGHLLIRQLDCIEAHHENYVATVSSYAVKIFSLGGEFQLSLKWCSVLSEVDELNLLGKSKLPIGRVSY